MPLGEYRLELHTTGYHKYAKRHEKDIMAEARDSYKILDRAKIAEWKEDVPREEGDWAETIVDEPEVIEDEMAVTIEDEVAVVDEDVLNAYDEPKPAPKKALPQAWGRRRLRDQGREEVSS